MTLNDKYDLIIVGTGMVESILSCVAAKNGKKVLHLDGNDYYGTHHASFTFSSMAKSFRPGFENPHRFVVLQNDFTSSCSLIDAFSTLNRWTDNTGKVHPSFLRACDKHKLASVERDQSKIHPAWFGVDHTSEAIIAYAKNDKDFSIDMGCKFLMGSGVFIDALIESGVSNYLDFNACGKIYFFQHLQQIIDKPGWKIPLNKNDIFMTNQLSAMDKRSLVKFQQFVADYCRQRNGADIRRLNELELAKGRSLHRPQNKSEAPVAVDQKSFKDILDSFKLSPSLQALIVHGLCLQITSESSVDVNISLNRVATFLDSVGRYGETAYLVPCYGISEILQGYCRMSAVWGTTFALRRSVSEYIQNDSDENVSVVDTEGNIHHGKFLVLNSSYLSLDAVTLEPWFILHSIHFYDNPIFEESRSVAVIPPNYRFASTDCNIDIGNQNAIFLSEKDSSTCCCPAGTYILHITTQIDRYDKISEWKGCKFATDVVEHYSDIENLIKKTILVLQHQSGGTLHATRQITYMEPVYQPKDISSRIYVSIPNSGSSLNIESEYQHAEMLWGKMFQEPFSAKNASNSEDITVDTPEDEENKEINELLVMLNKEHIVKLK
jgi:RAB protein geranylgeranyltransferase component A